MGAHAFGARVGPLTPTPTFALVRPRAFLGRIGRRIRRRLAFRSLTPFHEALELAPEGVVLLDRSWRFTFVNRRAEEISRMERKNLLGRPFREVFPGDEGALAYRTLETVRQQGETSEFEDYCAALDLWIQTSVRPTNRGVAVYFRDITRPTRDGSVVRLLADAGMAISRSLDRERMVADVADLVVPEWADWFGVDVLRPDGTIASAAVVHADPDKVEFARELTERFRPSLDDPLGPGHVIRTGEAQWIPIVTSRALRQFARDEEFFQGLQELGLRSAIMAPLVARGRTLGALTLLMAERRHRFTRDDLPHVQELGHHLALGLDNVQLYERLEKELGQRTEIEEELRRLNQTLEQRVAERTTELEEHTDRLRRMAVELIQTEQRERRRLARTLHDEYQQMLVAAKLKVEALEGRTPTASEVQAVLEVLDEAIQMSRSLAYELSPPALYAKGLTAALRALAPIKRRRYGLTVHVDVDEAAEPTEEDVCVFLFSLIRELLLNVVKHARADEAWVAMRPHEAEQVELVVEDRGRGFDVELLEAGQLESGGLGLLGMRERVLAMGGRLEVQSEPGQGTRVTIRVPMAVEKEEVPDNVGGRERGEAS